MVGLVRGCLVLVLAAVVSFSVQAQADGLPLLDRPRATGVIYSEVTGSGRVHTDQAWASLLRAGMDSYELAFAWDELEDADGDRNFTGLIELLDTIDQAGLGTYLSLKTIDTTVLRLPARFVDPGDPTRLRDGYSFDSPEIVDSIATLMLELAPVLADRGCFYISIGNEVDTWLAANPAEAFPFAVFAEHARIATHIVEPDLAVGVTLTREALVDSEIVQLMASVSDAPALTYYPVVDGVVLPTSVFASDLDLFEALIGGKQYLLQEAGCPSGELGGVLKTSQSLQRAWVRTVFTEIRRRPRARFVSWLHLADWSDATLDHFLDYYDHDSAAFREFLGTLGVMTDQGESKLALNELIRQVRATSNLGTLRRSP
ncbi:MAG: hypothetical protein ED559_03090 [Phycisphaera sp.]|nr:MAG: hypothetical protein ED559_03090 [Phycisphaera sp.]